MTSEKLYGTLKYLDELDSNLALQETLAEIVDALVNLTNQPAATAHQTSLARALADFESAAPGLRAISPSEREAIEAIGGEDFFDPSMIEKVKSAIQLNAMTPAVAKDFVQSLSNRRSKFLGTVKSAIQNLDKLNVGEPRLEPGSAELAFLIPRELFDNHLGPFAKELTFINRLIEHYSEAITGTAEQPELEQLSSSIPTIALWASAPVIAAIGKAVHLFLDAWEKVEKIRIIRAQLVEMRMKGKALQELDEQITTTVDEVVEESTQFVLANYKTDGNRKNELENAVRQDTKRLFGQIERGLKVEMRANQASEEGSGEEQKQALESVAQLAGQLRFPEVAKEPILLTSGQVLEGEFVAAKHSKKTSRKTTSTISVKKSGPVSNDTESSKGD
jgi:hypothetical protein